MKKLLKILAALFIAFCLFSCKEPAPYEGNYYNTEYIPSIPAAEYNQNYYNQSDVNKALYRKANSSKKGYEKKNNLTEAGLIAYIKSKAIITDDEIRNIVISYLEKTNYGYNMLIVDHNNNVYYILYIYSAEPVGTPTEVSFINPTNTDIEIYDVNNQKRTISAASTSTEKLYKDFSYYYMDGSDIVTFNFNSDNSNFILGRNIPVVGKKYICLNQYKIAEIEKDGNYYGSCLYEIIDSTNEYAYKYSDDIYICSFPSLRFWMDNSTFINDNLGKEVTYSDSLFNQYTITYSHTACGWKTQKEDKLWNHFIKNITLSSN